MHLAATQRSLRGISLLLANGASINVTDNKGRTPLHAACASSHDKDTGRGSSSGESDLALLECVELLLSSGALEDARDVNGQTALHLSALTGNLNAARALLAAGATAAADNAGNSPLHLAAAQGHSDVIQLLIAGNRDKPSWSPLPLEQGQTPAVVVREPHSAFGVNLDDVSLSAHGRGRGPGAVVPGRLESEVAATDGYTFDDNSPTAHVAPARDHRFGTRDNRPKSTRKATKYVGTEDSYSGYGGGGSHGVDNRRGWGEISSHRSDLFERRWQGQGDGDDHSRLFETPTENASYATYSRISGEDGHDMQAHLGEDPGHSHHKHHLRAEGKGGRRHGSGRKGGRYDDLDDRGLCWPDPLPAHKYKQVRGARVFHGVLQVRTTYEMREIFLVPTLLASVAPSTTFCVSWG